MASYLMGTIRKYWSSARHFSWPLEKLDSNAYFEYPRKRVYIFFSSSFSWCVEFTHSRTALRRMAIAKAWRASELVVQIQIEESRLAFHTLLALDVVFADANATFRVAIWAVKSRSFLGAFAAFAARFREVVEVFTAPENTPCVQRKIAQSRFSLKLAQIFCLW